jgi:ABC-type transporter lipoprotein component MlaA
MAFNDEFDKYILKPTAKDYQWIIPISINTHINMAHFLAHNDWIFLKIMSILLKLAVKRGINLLRAPVISNHYAPENGPY